MIFFFRLLVLSAGAFDSKTNFLQELRKKYGGGTFNLDATTSSDLSLYYSTLKEDYRKCSPRTFFQANYLGHQTGTYWLLSKDVSIN